MSNETTLDAKLDENLLIGVFLEILWNFCNYLIIFFAEASKV